MMGSPTPAEVHRETANQLLVESENTSDFQYATLLAMRAQVHAILAGPLPPQESTLLRQAEIDLEHAKEKIRHLERLLGDRLFEQVNNTDDADPDDQAPQP